MLPINNGTKVSQLFDMHIKSVLLSIFALPFCNSMAVAGIPEKMLLSAAMRAAEVTKGAVSGVVEKLFFLIIYSLSN
jgi:hypothetical protein